MAGGNVRCANCEGAVRELRVLCPRCGAELTAVSRRLFPLLPPAEAHGKERPAASVIVPSYQAVSTIHDTLRSLQEQDFRERFEVVVVDSSSDGTDVLVAREFPLFRLVHRSRRTEPGRARNLGVAAATGSIVACIDADCVAPTDWLRRMVEAVRAGHAVVGGAVENARPESNVAWAGFLGEFRAFAAAGEAREGSAATCNVAYERSLFERYGGFPPDFYPEEDLLYHWWLERHGVRVWFEPGITVRHVHRTRWAEYLRHQWRIGHVTAESLKVTGREGAALARFPIVAAAAASVLPWVRLGRTIGVLLGPRGTLLRRARRALPVFATGLFPWSLGFVAGAWSERPLPASDEGGQK